VAGAPLVVGVVVVTAALAVGCAAAGAAGARAAQLTGVADAAALAAADIASGLLPGDPCEAAGRIAAAGGATLSQCDVDGLIATVAVSAPAGALTALARARAGPPP
jgi:hypothetical protein